MTARRDPSVRTIGSGAGFAGDRVDPAVAIARSGLVDTVALECLAERTLVPGLRARKANPKAGADPRLRRRLTPAAAGGARQRRRVISNLGAANPAAAAWAIASLAGELGLRRHARRGDRRRRRDGAAATRSPGWRRCAASCSAPTPISAPTPMVDAVERGADVVVTGRVRRIPALFAADACCRSSTITRTRSPVRSTVGHLLECTGQVTGGNYEPPGGVCLPAEDSPISAFPLARVVADGTAEIAILDGTRGFVDRLTCTLQLLYEVHDPAAYITPDAIVDFSGVAIRGGRAEPRADVGRAPCRPAARSSKSPGLSKLAGVMADCEIGYAGGGALERARGSRRTPCADACRLARRRYPHRSGRREFDAGRRLAADGERRSPKSASMSRRAASMPKRRRSSRMRSTR